ncbi:MAG: ester cyclase [Cyanobacteriota bacterium]|nr:ester cyclase [Cyanobacteriota bacterium]
MTIPFVNRLTSRQPMHLSSGKALVQTFFDVYNTQNYSVLYGCMAANYFDHSLPQVKSIEDAITILQSTHSAFPDLRVEIDDLIEENNQVVFRGRFSGTHQGDFLGHSASGARVAFEAIEIFKIRDQKIAESWGYWPTADILAQIL